MATNPQPKAAAGSVSLTGAPATETPRAKVRVGYSPTLADHVIYADGVQGASVRLGVVHLELYQVMGAGEASRPNSG